jgi:hypothetical protein
MQHFNSITNLIKALDTLKPEEWVFTNLDAWTSKPTDCDFYYVPWDYLQSLKDDEVFTDDQGLELPIKLMDKNIKEWMLVNVLSHIVLNVKSKNEKISSFISQVNHYREFDTFNDNLNN